MPADSRYRPSLAEECGRALLHLDQPAAAVAMLRPLFAQQHTVSAYVELRAAAQASSQWEVLYPQVAAEMRDAVLSAEVQEEVLGHTQMISWPAGTATLAALLGYAYLLEGDWQAALAWATDPAVPHGWGDDDRARIVATGLLRMALAAKGGEPDNVLAQELAAAPALVREHGGLLESVARTLSAGSLLDGAVHLYEWLVERAAGGRNRESYASAGAYCRVLRSVRHAQDRDADFERYYQDLLVTYSRYAAFKDEVRTAIEGPGYPRKR